MLDDVKAMASRTAALIQSSMVFSSSKDRYPEFPFGRGLSREQMCRDDDNKIPLLLLQRKKESDSILAVLSILPVLSVLAVCRHGLFVASYKEAKVVALEQVFIDLIVDGAVVHLVAHQLCSF